MTSKVSKSHKYLLLVFQVDQKWHVIAQNSKLVRNIDFNKMTAEVRFGRWYSGEIFATSDDNVRLNEKGNELDFWALCAVMWMRRIPQTPREKK
jgi:hypothetical protein